MKNLKFIHYLMIVASSLMFMQCTSDYQSIDGVDGVDGIDGVDGADGTDGLDTSAAACIECHSDTHREGIYLAYFDAKHSSGSSWARGTSESCAACHNNEGFIDYIETGAVATGGYNISNPITCTGCHNDHRSFDFENDGNDMAVRTLDAVDFRVFAEDDNLDDYVLDYGNASNLCANCHQPRRGTPTSTDYPGKYMNTSTHWGPHHGPQTALLEGLLGAYTTFTLVEAIPAVQQAAHRTDTGACIDCHMGGTSDGSYGHSWNPAGTNCASCHSAPFEDLIVDGLAEDLETLGALLENVVGQAVARVDGEYEPVFEADGVTPVETIGIVHFDDGEWHPATGLFDLKIAEAAWNFLFIIEDKSGGIHNPNYANSIIKNSIAAIE
jgi:formate-dependent nitrite reductase cytochrome c552 subunit